MSEDLRIGVFVCECGINKDTTSSYSQAVYFRHLIRTMLLGNGHFAIQVIAIHNQQDIRQHLLRALVKIVNIFPGPGNDKQVGKLL